MACKGAGPLLAALLFSPLSPPPQIPSRLQQLGTYNPLPYSLDGAKEVRLRVDRIKYWLSVGAQPSERVSYLLWRAGLMPEPPIRWTTEKGVSKQKPAEGGGGGGGGGGKAGMHTQAGAGAGVGVGAGGVLGGAALRAPVGRPALGAWTGFLSRAAAPAAAPAYPLSVLR